MEPLLETLVVGLAVGVLARAFKPGPDNLGWVMTLLLGVTGSFLATYLGLAMDWYQQGERAGWLASIMGAMLLLALFSLVRGKG